MNYNNRKAINKLSNPDIYKLSEIIRYSNKIKIKNENVAEHSFYVVYNTMNICNYFNLDKDTRFKALEFAAIHDVPEMLTGDINFDIKFNNPDLNKLLYGLELHLMEQNLPEFVELYQLYSLEKRSETLPSLVVELADRISALQYMLREMELGNQSSEMEMMRERQEDLISETIDKIKEKIKE